MGASTAAVVGCCLSLPPSPLSSPSLCRHALCFWLCLSMAVIRWKTQGNRFDSLRPKANEIENIRESCEPKLNRRRLQSTRSLNPLSGRCIIKYPFRCAKASAEFPRMRRRVQLIGSGNSSHWNQMHAFTSPLLHITQSISLPFFRFMGFHNLV